METSQATTLTNWFTSWKPKVHEELNQDSKIRLGPFGAHTVREDSQKGMKISQKKESNSYTFDHWHRFR